MQHFLKIKDDEGERIWELNADSSSVGRDAKNSIVLHSPDISRQHAILLRLTRPGEIEHTFRLIDGNLQGKPSTNGFSVNGERCTVRNLRHGDTICFGNKVEGLYAVVSEGTDIDWLLSSNQEEAIDYMATLIGDRKDPLVEPENNKLDDSILARLASFPELFLHPIVEFSLTGEVTYLNPSAVEKFPEIRTEGCNHPIIVGAVDAVLNNYSHQFVREIAIHNHTFEQSLSYIPQSELIRSYLVEITDRKQEEQKLKALHIQLEIEVEQRTLQFNEASNRLRQEEQALVSSYATNRALLNAMPDNMFRINRGGIIVNSKTPKQYNLIFDPKQCLQRHISEIWPVDIVDSLKQCIEQALVTDKMQILEFQMSEFFFEARIAVSAADEVMVILRDITERKQIEEETRRALERERELNELKTQFVSMTSHEFRTPLTTIMSSADLLERYNSRWDDEKKLVYLRKIQTATRHMTELLNDVLLISKAEAGKLEFSPQQMVLEDFCQSVVEDLQMSTTFHTLSLRSHIPHEPILIDRKLMRHILTNLLSNAIKYSPGGGEIVITLNQGVDEIELQIKDFGIGIPKEAKATLFDSFCRASNVGTISGTGLGLAIVKQSVDLHQGQITCHSVVGEGSTFIVKLPLNLPSANTV